MPVILINERLISKIHVNELQIKAEIEKELGIYKSKVIIIQLKKNEIY